jgi:RHS repeat-associated protein
MLIAMSENATLKYIHQACPERSRRNELGGTSVMSNTSGALLGTIKYAPFGATRSVTGAIATDKKFTGQELDDTGLYYYNARYYDPTIGRFISPETVIPNPANPQCFNRYTYCLNNPLRYTDPSGNIVEIEGRDVQDIDRVWNEYDYNSWTTVMSN